jgi:hypothetical protein
MTPVEGAVDAERRRKAWSGRAGIAAAAAFAGCLIWALLDHRQFFQSYLVAYFFWLSLALGCLGIRMMFELTGGAWGVVMLPQLEAAIATIPWLALLFLPILPGLKFLYPWARGLAKGGATFYMTTPWFVVRAAIYFACWSFLSFAILRLSRRKLAGDAEAGVRLATLSGPGLAAYALTMTFAAIDWGMSLEPDWYSTVYGMSFVTGQGLLAYAAMIVLAAAPASAAGLFARELPDGDTLNDLGNLLFAFVMLWAYMAFSQLLVIWSGNLPHEIPFYTSRGAGSWGVLSGLLIVFHFAAPVFILLMRTVKRRAAWLAAIAAFLVFMRWVDYFWLVVPALSPSRLDLSALELLTFAAVGGTWIFFFLRAA